MRALERVTAILEAVGSTPAGATVTETADRTGLSLPTASRLMRDLADEGLLQRGDGTRLYKIGARLLAIARTATESNPVLDVALPSMVLLRDQTGETVSMHMASGNRRVCIAEVQSTQEVRRVVPVGLSLPLHYGATGEVLLACLPAAERESYLASLELDATAARRLRDHLALIRERGWAAASETWSQGVAGLAAAIIGPDGSPYSLSVSGPSNRWTLEVIAEHAEAVNATAKAVSTRLGSPILAAEPARDERPAGARS